MRKSLSIYLDLLRLLAALGVLIGHSQNLLTPWISNRISGHSSECVAVFFVLSGFVISFVTTERERTWQDYASARFARIASVVFLAIAVGFALDFIGSRINIAPYRTWHGWNLSPSPGEAIAYVTFTNEIWFRHAVIGTLEPYWSLGFEGPYYVAFAIAWFARGWWRVVLLLAWSAIVGPKILTFLPLWLLGVGAFQIIRRRRKPNSWHSPAGAALFVSGVVGFYIVRTRMTMNHGTIYMPESFSQLRNTGIYFTLIGLATALNIVGFDMLVGDRDIWKNTGGRMVRWLAGGSFSIYLFHLPMVVFMAALFPGIPSHPVLGVAALGLVLSATYACAEVGERRKRPFRAIADALLRHTLPRG